MSYKNFKLKDRASGYGKFVHTDGSYYEGEWLDDQ